MNKSGYCIVPVLLLLFSFYLRFSLISKGPYHIDCLNLAIQSENTLTQLKIQYLFGSGYPLTVILGACFVFFCRLLSIQDPVYAVNLMSVVLSSLSIPLLYLFVKRLFDQRTAFFSSVMFSVFPYFLGVSIYGKSHTPSIFFLLLGLLFLTKYKQASLKKDLIISAVNFGLMGAARLQDLIFFSIPLTLFYFSPSQHTGSKETRRARGSSAGHFLLACFIAGFIIFLFHLPLFLKESGGASYTGQFSKFWNLGVSTNFRGFFSPSFRISLSMITFGLSPGGTLIALLGLGRLAWKRFMMFSFLLMWILLPLSFYGNLNTTVPRFLIISIIPLVIAQGYFFSYLSSVKRKLFQHGSVFTFCLIVSLIFSQIYPILYFRHQYDLFPAFGRFVNSLTEENATIIAGDDALFISYYGQRKMLMRPRSAFSYDKEELLRFSHAVDQILEKGEPVYITYTGLYSYDTHRAFSKIIFDRYLLRFIGERYVEEWYSGETILRIRPDRLFKITKKS